MAAAERRSREISHRTDTSASPGAKALNEKMPVHGDQHHHICGVMKMEDSSFLSQRRSRLQAARASARGVRGESATNSWRLRSNQASMTSRGPPMRMTRWPRAYLCTHSCTSWYCRSRRRAARGFEYGGENAGATNWFMVEEKYTKWRMSGPTARGEERTSSMLKGGELATAWMRGRAPEESREAATRSLLSERAKNSSLLEVRRRRQTSGALCLWRKAMYAKTLASGE
mmetsp:Transcript_70251/g.146393  ORF Transcript_70251/g.146393 Transcript_70251/m.146393 type:complete len:229 (-) Transcript_70251:603-1289(-)